MQRRIDLVISTSITWLNKGLTIIIIVINNGGTGVVLFLTMQAADIFILVRHNLTDRSYKSNDK